MISADSLQVYRGLNIGTAKPDAGLLARIPHHLIDILDFTEPFNIGEFCRLADACVEEILSRGMLPVISGGTAYYLKGWLMGLPGTPPADPAIREAVARKWRNVTDGELKRALERVDPASAAKIADCDRYRMLRALEVHEQTGKPLSAFPVPDTPRGDYDVLLIGLMRTRSDLNRRIEERVDAMFTGGLGAEVAALREQGAERGHPGMKAIGYREWFSPDGGQDPEEQDVRDLVVRNTRRYAKRQMTFFASLPGVRWFDAADNPDAPGGVVETVSVFLGAQKAADASLDQGSVRGHNP